MMLAGKEGLTFPVSGKFFTRYSIGNVFCVVPLLLALNPLAGFFFCLIQAFV